MGFSVNSVVITLYRNQVSVDKFIKKLNLINLFIIKNVIIILFSVLRTLLFHQQVLFPLPLQEHYTVLLLSLLK